MKASQGPIRDILKLAEGTQMDQDPLIGQPYLPLDHDIESYPRVHLLGGVKILEEGEVGH